MNAIEKCRSCKLFFPFKTFDKKMKSHNTVKLGTPFKFVFYTNYAKMGLFKNNDLIKNFLGI